MSEITEKLWAEYEDFCQARSLRARHRLSVRRAASPSGCGRASGVEAVLAAWGIGEDGPQIAAGVDGGLEGGRRDRAGVLPGPAHQRARGSAARGQRRGVRDHPGDRGTCFPRSARQRLPRTPDAQSRGQGLGGSMAGIQGPGHSLLSGALAGDCAPTGDRHPRRLRQRPAERARLLRR